ncbi:hypothetical protein HY485_02895 [Candidatus Woesearchaeota archaeon]|nr:hypothetical protein [Candidatus Woesearchaeota archaeon]
MDKTTALCKLIDAITHPSPGAREKVEVKQKTTDILKGLEDIAKNAGVSDAQIDLVTRILRFNICDSDKINRIDVKYGYGTSTIKDSRLGLYVDVLLNSEFANKNIVQKLVSGYNLPCKELLSKEFYLFFEAEGINVRFFDVNYWCDRSG